MCAYCKWMCMCGWEAVVSLKSLSQWAMTKCVHHKHTCGTHKHRTHGTGNPIKNGSADKSDEYIALPVIPNFTPQHFSPFRARMGVQLESEENCICNTSNPIWFENKLWLLKLCRWLQIYRTKIKYCQDLPSYLLCCFRSMICKVGADCTWFVLASLLFSTDCLNRTIIAKTHHWCHKLLYAVLLPSMDELYAVLWCDAMYICDMNDSNAWLFNSLIPKRL